MLNQEEPEKTRAEYIIGKILLYFSLSGMVSAFGLSLLFQINEEPYITFSKNIVKLFHKVLPWTTIDNLSFSLFFIFLLLIFFQQFYLPTREQDKISRTEKRLKHSLKQLEKEGLGDGFHAKEIRRQLDELSLNSG